MYNNICCVFKSRNLNRHSVTQKIMNTFFSTSSDHKVLFECLKFMETILEKPYANMALYNFLNKSTTVKLLDILLLYPASKGIFDPRYANMSLRVLNKLAYHGIISSLLSLN